MNANTIAVGEPGGFHFLVYEDVVLKMARYPNIGANKDYPALGLAGESGEVAEHVKKCLRDDAGILTEERKARVRAELGDVLWYVAALLRECGSSMDRVTGFHTFEEFSAAEPLPPRAATPTSLMFCMQHAVGSVCRVLENQRERVQYWRANTGIADREMSQIRSCLYVVLRCLDRLALWADTTLSGVAKANVEKLQGRHARGTIHGNGDDR